MSISVKLHLQTQVVSIIETLAKSAIAEINKVINEETEMLLLAVSQSKKDNEALNQRLLQLEKELQAARGGRTSAEDGIHTVQLQIGDEIRGTDTMAGDRNEDRSLLEENVFGKQQSVSLWSNGGHTAMKEEEAQVNPVICEEALQRVDDRLGLFSVKIELFERNIEDCNPVGGLRSSGHFEQEGDPTERQYSKEADQLLVPAEVTEEASTQWADAGDRLEPCTLPITMEGTAEMLGGPDPPQCSLGSGDAYGYVLHGQSTNVADGQERAGRKPLTFTCCERLFSDFVSFRQHQQTCLSRSGSHLCPKTEFVHHEIAEIGQKTLTNSWFSCGHCTENFTSTYDLERHQAIHREKPFRCSDCGKCYFEKCHLDSHQCSHTGGKLYKCIICGTGFSQEVQLRVHKCSQKSEDLHGSSWSGENSPRKSTSESQHNIYQEGRFYSCAACQRSFINIHSFEQYLCIHTPKKSHRCLECGKCFTERSSLNVHLRTIHAGEKPYSCAECGKSFTQKANFQKHWVIHTGEKPYKCLECGKRFTEKGYLKKHSAMHRGVKPYRCNECGKSFYLRGSLNSHVRSHRR